MKGEEVLAVAQEHTPALCLACILIYLPVFSVFVSLSLYISFSLPLLHLSS